MGENLNYVGKQWGETATAKSLGLTRKFNYKYMWVKCPKCEQGKWVQSMYVCLDGITSKTVCKDCRNQTTKARRKQVGDRVYYGDYVIVYICESDPYFPMTKGTRSLPEHRYIMAKHLGKCLTSDEVVHHKNGIRDDNRIENLELFTTNHTQHTCGQRIEDLIVHYLDLMKEDEAYSVIMKSRHFRVKFPYSA